MEDIRNNPRARRVLAPLLAVLALAAAACGGGSNDSGSGDKPGGGEAAAKDCPVDALESSEGLVEITVWHSLIGLPADTVEQLAQGYNDSQDKVVVTAESQGANYEEQKTKFLAALRDPSTLPNIMLAEDTDTQSMIDSQAAIPAQACMDADPEGAEVYDDLIPAVASAYTIEGVQWPAAFGVNSPELYYNKSHFAQAGLDPESPPRTLEEIRTAAEAIATAKAEGKVIQGNGEPVPDGPPFVYRVDSWWLEHLATGNGDALVDNNNGRDGLATESLLLNDTTSRFSDWISSMVDDKLQKTIPYAATFDAYLAMATQSASMMLDTSTAATTIDALITGTLKAEDIGLDAGTDLSGLEFPDLDLGVGQQPGLDSPGTGQIGGNAWYLIGAGSSPEQIAASWDFLKWINQTPQLVKWTMQGSFLPVFTRVREDPDIQAYFTDSRAGRWLATGTESLEALDPEFPGPVIGPYKALRNAVRTAIEESMLGDVPTEKAFATADETFQEALDTYAEEVGA